MSEAEPPTSAADPPTGGIKPPYPKDAGAFQLVPSGYGQHFFVIDTRDGRVWWSHSLNGPLRPFVYDPTSPIPPDPYMR